MVIDKTIKYILYLLVFLLPLFFLPYTVFPVALNKQTFLAFLVFLIFILWIAKVMNSGKIIFRKDKLTKSILLLLLIFGISFAFSASKNQSFWGTSAEADTFFSFILYVFIFLFFANLLEKKEILKVISIFFASSGVIAVLFLINSFIKIFPWDFARVAGFNPIGSAQGLSVFFGGALVIMVALLAGQIPKKAVQGLIVFFGGLLFAVILLINFWVTWLLIAFGTAIVILGKLHGSDVSSQASPNILKNFGIPLVILVLSLAFIFIKVPLNNILNVSPEVSLTYKATFDIANKTLLEGSKNFILGSSPATFAYQYGLHRTAALNLTDFWQFKFGQGTAAMPTFLANLGVFGLLAILLMMAVFIWYGFKSLVRLNQSNQLTNMVVFVAGFYFLLSWFFYTSNLSLMFAGFLMMGLWVAATEAAPKEISLYQTPQKTFWIMFLGIILLAGGVIGFYNVGQKYAGAINYSQGLDFFNQENKLNEAIVKVNNAVGLDQKDNYLRTLSQLFLIKTNEILNNPNLSQEQKKSQLQQSVPAAETSALKAIQINPKDSLNWLHLGSVYENVASLVEGTNQLAIQNYQKAGELDPQNPQISLNIGRIYLMATQEIQQNLIILEMAEEKDEKKLGELRDLYEQNLELALQNFQKSKELKTNFGPAYYLAAQTYEVWGKNDLALENYQAILILEPGNEQIKAKIETLRESLENQ
jgi:hypothetical protein